MGDIVDNTKDNRFEPVVEGHLAASFYKTDGHVITFIHTEVPSELGGRGVGSTLMQGALDQAKRERKEGDRRLSLRQRLDR